MVIATGITEDGGREVLGVMVTAADAGDRTTAQVLLHQVADAHHRPALIWAEGGYTSSLIEYCLAALALVVSIVKHSDDMRGFVEESGHLPRHRGCVTGARCMPRST
ncbi:transposase [Streptomyces sp. NPDC020951]|uniref:transposase n=1 Tax=Streptomyces sp. NPDC020951 TaxID=3365104 RepID=UPI00378E8108